MGCLQAQRLSFMALHEASTKTAPYGPLLGTLPDREIITADDWKILFLDALDRETRMVPNLDGTGMVGIGRSSSSLSKEEFSGLLSIVYEWGSRNGVEWSDKPDE